MTWPLIAAVVLIAALAGVVIWRRQYRLRALWRLKRLAATYARDGERQRLFVGLSRLMRDTAERMSGEFPVAGMSGRRWQVFLDETGDTEDFTRGPGRWLADAPYQDEATLRARDIEPEAVIEACRRWLRHSHFNPARHR